MELHEAKASGAQNLAIYLGGLGGISLLGAIVMEIRGDSPFGLGTLAGAHILLTGLAVLAGALEWGRERLAEGLSTAAVAASVVLTLIDLANGAWYYAPFLGITSLFCIFALVTRYMERDEALHEPRLFLQGAH